MASECKKCGNKDNYNFALNIGLCDPCIGAELEQLEADNRRLKEAIKKAIKRCIRSDGKCPYPFCGCIECTLKQALTAGKGD